MLLQQAAVAQPLVVSIAMKIFDFSSIIPPGAGEDYDADNPTRQTELLALSLRKLFYTFQGDPMQSLPSLEIRQLEPSDYSGVPDAVEALGEDVLAFLSDSSGEYGSVPALPSLTTVISALIPVIMSGGSGLAAFLPALLPYILEGGLQLIKHKLFEDSGDNSEALELIAEKLEKGLVRTVGSSRISQLDSVNTISNTLKSIDGAVVNVGSIFSAVAASLDSLDRLLQEIEEATPIAIMHTSEIDKVVYITP